MKLAAALNMKTNAFGQPVPALCFSEGDDERLALGHPHRIELFDGGLDAKKATKLAAKAAYDTMVHLGALRVRFPREVASRFVRGAHTPEFQDWTRNTPPPESAFDDDSPIPIDEARELVKKTVAVPGCTFNGNHRAALFVLEALASTEVIADAILDTLEAIPDKRYAHESGGPNRKTGGAVTVLGFMLLRLTSGSRAAREQRLRALLERAHAACKKADSTNFEIVCPMEEVVSGWAATRRASPTPALYSSHYLLATNDLDRLRARIAAPDTIYENGVLDVRFVYLLGPEILETLGKRRPRKEAVPIMFEDLGMIRHPAVVSLFLEYVGKPMAKKLPLEWFKAHADYARPLLEESRSANAKMMLKAIKE